MIINTDTLRKSIEKVAAARCAEIEKRYPYSGSPDRQDELHYRRSMAEYEKIEKWQIIAENHIVALEALASAVKEASEK